MSCHYAASICVKLRMDLPDEWVRAFSQLVDAPKPEEVMFPAIPDLIYFIDGELAFVRGGADGDELDKIRGVSTF
ncbi:MAG: hypothetical protein HQ582_17170 [Planctomycetes bacterium]|nr:hypothetical protein [Planctomycetota bacterium]